MSSFGSQARLAELTAAASARERQAKRELEEQNKPPKTAPVSLSAFTKTVANSGNRGNKAFRPLTLEDIKEQEAQELTSVDGASSVEEEYTAEATAQPIFIADARRTASAVLERQRSQQLRSQTKIEPPYFPDPMPLHPSFQMHPMQHMHSMPMQQHHLPTPYQAMPQSAPAEPQHYPFANYMMPDDISPSKQEEKFMEMSNDDVMSEEAHVGMQYPQDSSIHEHLQYNQFAGEEMSQTLHTDLSHMQIGRPDMQYPNLSGLQSAPYSYQHYAPQSSTQARSSANNVNMTPMRSVSGPVNTPSSNVMPTRYPSQTPFDNFREMEKFIVEEKARTMARQSKTVTNNPDRQDEGGNATINTDTRRYHHSTRSEDMPSPASTQYEVLPPPTVAQIAEDVLGRRPRATAEEKKLDNAIRNPPKGLDPPLTFTPAKVEELEDDDTYYKRVAALCADPDFMSLQPPNAKDQRRTREVMAKAARHMTVTDPEQDTTISQVNDNNSLRLGETVTWFHSDNRGASEVRSHLEHKICSQEAFRRRQAATRLNNGVLPPDFKLGIDDGLAANLSLSHIYANIETYLSIPDPNNPTGDHSQVFHKVKPVPEWATARTEEEKGSYFSEKKGGWMQPPQRIARDPRFRPAPTPPMAATSLAMPVTPARPISRVGNAGAALGRAVGVSAIGSAIGGNGAGARAMGRNGAVMGMEAGHNWQAGRRM